MNTSKTLPAARPRRKKALIAGLPPSVAVFKTSNGRGEASFRVKLGRRFTGGQVVCKNFSTLEAAWRWVEAQCRSQEAIVSMELTPDHLAQARAAFARLGDTPLEAAVSFFLAHSTPVGGRRTLAEVITEHLQAMRERAASDPYVYAQRVATGVLARDFGAVPIATITAEDLRAWFRRKGWKPLNRRNYMRDLGMLFHFAHRRNYVPENPFSLIDRPKVSQATPGIYSAREAETLLRVADEQPGWDLVPWLAVGLFSGVRVAEMKKLFWEDVDLEEKCIHIRSKVAAKNGRPRDVSLSENAMAWLEGFAGRKGPFFDSTGARHRWNLLFAAAESRLVTGSAGGVKSSCVVDSDKLRKRNGLRHSYASHHYVAHDNAELTRSQIGQESKSILFKHYVQAVTKRDASAYWAIRPGRTLGSSSPPPEADPGWDG